jgi:choice-of-anchor A domain-containing protein
LRFWSPLLTMALLPPLVSIAQASPLPVATLLGDFNVITDQNLSTTSDVEGLVLVGGNLSGNGIIDSKHVAVTPPAGFGQINVFGNNSGSWSEAVAHPAVLLGGGNTGTGKFLNAGSVTTGYTFPGSGPTNANTFATDIWAPLTAYSSQLSGLTPNSTFTPATSTFSANPVSGLAVFDISATNLAKAKGNLIFTGLTAADHAVINVDGSYSQTFNYGGFAEPNVLWNFFNATSLRVSLWQASILAPDALVENTGPINGDLVAAGLAASGEVHWHPPNLPAIGEMPPVDPVPEPGTLSVLGTALASLNLFRRRAALRP